MVFPFLTRMADEALAKIFQLHHGQVNKPEILSVAVLESGPSEEHGERACAKRNAKAAR